MRNLKVLAFAAAASTLFAGSLQASGPTGFGRVMFAGVGGTSSCYQYGDHSSAGCWYTSPYKASFLLEGGNLALLQPAPAPIPVFQMGIGGPVVDIFCVDFGHHVSSYSANFSNLADIASVNTYTRQQDQTKYLQAAWLSQQLGDPANATANAAINGAIWSIMGWPLVYASGSSTIDWWKNQAGLASNWGRVDAAGWVVVTDRTAAGQRDLGGQYAFTQGQEYIVNVTPEPATLLLLGTGLLATLMAAGALRRSAV